MPDRRQLADMYFELAEEWKPEAVKDTAAMDQNNALLREWAAELDLDLRDPDVFAIVAKSAILISAFYFGHIEGMCTEPACLASAIGHVQCSTGQLANHLDAMAPA